MKKSEKELREFYDFFHKQLLEDRNTIKELYGDLKNHCTAPEHYAVNGQNLGKYAELLLKSTSQIIEFIKVTKDKESKNDSDNDNLNFADIEKIYSDLKQ